MKSLRLLFIALALAAACSGCASPYSVRFPAGDGKLTDTNGAPVHVDIKK